MNTVLLECLNFFLVSVEFLVMIVLSSGFFRMNSSKKQSVLACVLTLCVNYSLMLLLEHLTLLKLIAICLSFAILLKVIYKAHITPCLVLSVMYLSIVNVLDGVVLLSFSGITGMGIDRFLENPYGYYSLAFFSKIIELFLVALIRTWAQARFHNRPVSAPAYLRICILPAIVLIFALVLLKSFVHDSVYAPQLLLCVIVLLVTDVAAIMLLNQFENQQQALMEKRIIQQELKLAYDHITSLSDSYAHEKRITHDFQNRLSVIQGLLNKDRSGQAAQEYINGIILDETSPCFAISTNRTVLDVLLKQKHRMAIQKGIAFHAELDDMSEFPLPDDALVVVVANLLDNAIEACDKITDMCERKIVVKASVMEHEGILVVENSVAEPVKIINGIIKTTKKDTFRHGYGLQNVISIISKHNGSYAMDSSDNKFVFVIQIIS